MFNDPAHRWLSENGLSHSPKIVAVVDDDPSILDATSAFLQALGYDTAVFQSGAAFLASDLGPSLALLLSDVGMPGLSGFELQAAVRVRYPALPVILMSALQDNQLRWRALAAGARCFLVKPILADDLIRCLSGGG